MHAIEIATRVDRDAEPRRADPERVSNRHPGSGRRGAATFGHAAARHERRG